MSFLLSLPFHPLSPWLGPRLPPPSLQSKELQKIAEWETPLKGFEKRITAPLAPMDAAQIRFELDLISFNIECSLAADKWDHDHQLTITKLTERIKRVMIGLYPRPPPAPPKPKAITSVEPFQKRLAALKTMVAPILAKSCPKVGAMIEMVVNSPRASRLLYRALTVHGQYKTTPLIVSLVPKGKVPFGAECNYTDGAIYISEEHSDKQRLASFLFELTNVIHTPDVYEVDQKVKEKKITSEHNYAYARESIEYKGVAMVHQLVASCVDYERWDSSLDQYKNNWKDFFGYWTTQFQSGHVQFYKDQYKRLFKNG